MDIDGNTIAAALTFLGAAWAWLRRGDAKERAVDAADELRAAVMAELEHVLLDDPDGTAHVAEKLLRDAATAAANRLKLSRRVADPLVRLAVQAGMSEVRRRLAQARAERVLRDGPAALHAAASAALDAMRDAEARGEAAGRRTFEGVQVEIVAPGASGEASEHASGSGDNGAGSEPPPAPLPSGTGR